MSSMHSDASSVDILLKLPCWTWLTGLHASPMASRSDQVSEEVVVFAGRRGEEGRREEEGREGKGEGGGGGFGFGFGFGLGGWGLWLVLLWWWRVV